MEKVKIRLIYEKLLQKLKEANDKPSQHQDSYGGNKDKKLHLRIATIRKIAQDLVAANKNLTTSEWVELFGFLSNGEFDEEKQLIGKILENHSDLRKSISSKEVEKILAKMEGWSQVDSVCQSVFGAKELLLHWEEWKKTIKTLTKSPNLNKRRAGLVLLTAPVRQSTDEGFANLGLEVIDKAKGEKDKLITKAISWLLREMIKNHRAKVEEYLENNKDSLPSIAVRETENKLRTGKK
ncbi:MAG: DNA alkylation repair protein [Candidatus Shapirobacteria bacterium]|nr:DNA alkylation repair protein [Candidatus Shapirobacteria bacterium]